MSKCCGLARKCGSTAVVPLIGGNYDRHYITCFSKGASSPIAPVAHTSLSVPTLGEPYEAKPAGLPRDIERGHSSEAHLELPCAPSSCFVSVSFSTAGESGETGGFGLLPVPRTEAGEGVLTRSLSSPTRSPAPQAVGVCHSEPPIHDGSS